MKWLICGGRKFCDANKFDLTLTEHILRTGIVPDSIISGGAYGADTLTKMWAKSKKIQFYEYRAQWGRYGKSAGILRNIEMLEHGKPDLVIAFPGGKGTDHMIKISIAADVETIIVPK